VLPNAVENTTTFRGTYIGSGADSFYLENSGEAF
jgi:hypothetical protein